MGTESMKKNEKMLEEDEEIFVNAAEEGNIKVVREMIEDGIDVNIKGSYGYTALMAASVKGHIAIVELLLENGADESIQSKSGATSLMEASYYGHTGVVKLLLEAGTDVNADDDFGNTALILASSRGRIEIVRLLLKAGANINVMNEKGMTALMLASYHGYAKVVKLLLSQGVDVNAKNEDGETALDLAKWRNHVEIIKLLQSTGAEEVLKENKMGTRIMKKSESKRIQKVSALKTLTERRKKMKKNEAEGKNKDSWIRFAMSAAEEHWELRKKVQKWVDEGDEALKEDVFAYMEELYENDLLNSPAPDTFIDEFLINGEVVSREAIEEEGLDWDDVIKDAIAVSGNHAWLA